MSMNRIKEYIIYDRRKRICEAAQEIGFTKEHLCSVLNGKTPCGIRLATALSEWSGGKFSVKKIKSIL
jgi:hypothetical protein